MSLIDRLRRRIGRRSAEPETELRRLVRQLQEGKDQRTKWRAAEALADLGDPEAFDPLARAMVQSLHYDYAGVAVALARLDPERAAPLLAQYRARPTIDTANLLAELGCVEAVPELKRDLDRGAFAAYSTSTIERFLERHQELWAAPETAVCHVCGTERPVTELRPAGELWFCPGECWRASGEILSRGIGTDCPLYDRGFCTAGDGDAYCSLEVGTYEADCHVYAIHRDRA